MNNASRNNPRKSGKKPAGHSGKKEKLAEALRRNLLRRKQAVIKNK